MLIHGAKTMYLAMRTQQSTNSIHQQPDSSCFTLHARFLSFLSTLCFDCDLLRLRDEILDERTELHARYSLLKVKLTTVGREWRCYFSLIFIYSGPVIAAENGRLQTGFVGGTESRLQQEDRLAYRDHTHHGESDIGGSRLLSISSSNFTTVIDFRLSAIETCIIGRWRDSVT